MQRDLTIYIGMAAIILILLAVAGYMTNYGQPHAGQSAPNPTSAVGGPAGSTQTTAQAAYQTLYNGDFSNGYSGWQVNGTGFGTAPMNITYANSKNCYVGQPWANYNGTFFATTYNCGLSNAPGNITSSAFYVTSARPYLNFRVISPDLNDLYLQVLRNGKPIVFARYNTYNTSLGFNASSTFRNASINLSQYAGSAVQIRVVAASLQKQRFIAVGNFRMSPIAVQQRGALVNLTYYK